MSFLGRRIIMNNDGQYVNAYLRRLSCRTGHPCTAVFRNNNISCRFDIICVKKKTDVPIKYAYNIMSEMFSMKIANSLKVTFS